MMNKQELIDEIENEIPDFVLNDYLRGKEDGLSYALESAKELDEPQKPVIPKFVAEWVDNSREYSFDFDEWFDCENQPPKVYYWLNSENKRQAELNTLALVTLIVNGANAVEIEQEKLYTVEIPDPHGLYKIRYLYRCGDGNIRIGGTDYRDIFSTTETHLTEAEIKKDFEWAWQWAKEVEWCYRSLDFLE